MEHKTNEEKNKVKIKQFFMKNNEEKIKKILTCTKININDVVHNNESKKYKLDVPEFNKEDIFGHIKFYS
jgi:hypothetical protein